MNRMASRRDPPIAWCVLGVLPMIFAVAGFFIWREDTVDRSSLKQVSGRLTAFDFPRLDRNGPRGIRVFLDDTSDGDKLYVADQRIYSDCFPALRTLRVGDQVTALMRTYESTTCSL